MEYKKVLKFLEIVGSIFIILSLVEIAYIILLNFTQFYLDGIFLQLSDFIYTASIIPLSGTFLWLFVNISMFCFLILGIFMYKIASNKTIESSPLAKLLVVIGMVILLGGFIKMEFLVILGKTNITTISGSIAFQSALFDPIITPIIPAIFWIFFISVNCAILITGLAVTAVGIKWTLLHEKIENPA
ncbi:MAG: hypothetical protein JSV23_07195 [Promethearchaeota archaeon]|nr:MAG: hypothetical protein JSV23_07195 [Candidatus Lokiarchaeota archaeon]